MKRYAAFDPPEYVAWTPDDAERERFGRRSRAHPERAAIIDSLGEDQLLELYRGLVRTRLIDVALKRLVKQGVISKAWLGTGEEAATIGPVHALRRGRNADVVAPMIRNAGACNEMGMTVADMFRAYMGTGDGPSHGRDGHYGDFSRGILPPVSIVGDCAAVVTGIALALRARQRDNVALTWIGDGSTKAGVLHEGLNFAAVRRVPVIFIIQNNQVALGTRSSSTTWRRAGKLRELAEGVRDVGRRVRRQQRARCLRLTSLAVERCRRGEGPALLVAETFRMGGHATHDEAEARRTFDSELFGVVGPARSDRDVRTVAGRAGYLARAARGDRAGDRARSGQGEQEALESRAQRTCRAARTRSSGVYHQGKKS